MTDEFALKSNRYALKALKDRRAQIAGEILQLKQQWKSRQKQLVHIDATLRLLDPNVDIDALPKRRTIRHVKLFRQGELGRIIFDAMRNAQGPLTTADIAEFVMQRGGYPEEAWRTIRTRTGQNLRYLERLGRIDRSGSGKATRWQIDRMTTLD